MIRHARGKDASHPASPSGERAASGRQVNYTYQIRSFRRSRKIEDNGPILERLICPACHLQWLQPQLQGCLGSTHQRVGKAQKHPPRSLRFPRGSTNGGSNSEQARERHRPSLGGLAELAGTTTCLNCVARKKVSATALQSCHDARSRPRRPTRPSGARPRAIGERFDLRPRRPWHLPVVCISRPSTCQRAHHRSSMPRRGRQACACSRCWGIGVLAHTRARTCTARESVHSQLTAGGSAIRHCRSRRPGRRSRFLGPRPRPCCRPLLGLQT